MAFQKPVLVLAAAALLGATAAHAQVQTQAQIQAQTDRELQRQLEHDREATDRQLRQSRVLNQKAQDNIADIQAQGQAPVVNPALQPTVPAYGFSSSSAARRAAAEKAAGAPIGTQVPTAAKAADMVGGPLILPGPTDPAVRDFAAKPEPAPDQPASTTPVR